MATGDELEQKAVSILFDCYINSVDFIIVLQNF